MKQLLTILLLFFFADCFAQTVVTSGAYSQNVIVPSSGRYKITFSAKGTKGGSDYPNVQVKVGTIKAGSIISVNSASFNNYSVLADLNAGNQTITVNLLNSGSSRSFTVNSLTLNTNSSLYIPVRDAGDSLPGGYKIIKVPRTKITLSGSETFPDKYMQAIIKLPPSRIYDQNKKFGLIFFSCGKGESEGQDIGTVISNGIAGKIAFKNQEPYYVRSPGDTAWYISVTIHDAQATIGTNKYGLDAGGENMAYSVFKNVIPFLRNNYKVDNELVALTGLSIGGLVSFKTICQADSNFLKQITCVLTGSAAGGGWQSNANLENIAKYNIHVWMAHGTADQTVKYSIATSYHNKIASFNPATPNVLRPVEGADHTDEVWDSCFDKNYTFWNGKTMYQVIEESRREATTPPPVVLDAALRASPSNVTFTGTPIHVELDADASTGEAPLTFTFFQTGGPVSTIAADGSTSTATLTEPGIYNFQVTVKDKNGNSDVATAKVTVNTQAELPDIVVKDTIEVIPATQSSVTLDGSLSTGTIVKWVVIEPSDGTVTITNATSKVATATGLQPGRHYKFLLTGYDNQGVYRIAQKVVFVKPSDCTCP